MSFLENSKFAFRLLVKPEKARLLFVLLFQMLTGLLDLLGVVSITLFSLFIIRGDSKSDLVSRLIPYLNSLDSQTALRVLGAIAVISLLSKTLFSYLSIRLLARELSKIQFRLSTQIFRKSFSLQENRFKEIAAQDLGTNVVDGTGAITVGILGGVLVIISESFLLLILFLPILILSPILGLALVSIFGLAFFFLQNFLSEWTRKVGKQRFISQNIARNDIYLSGKLSKSIYAGMRYDYFNNVVENHMKIASKSNSESFLIQQIPKYVLEITVVLIGFSTAVILSLLGSFGKSISLLAMIISASTRLLPSLLKIQSSFILNKASSGESANLINLLKEIGDSQEPDFKQNKSRLIEITPPKIRVIDLGFSYKNEMNPLFQNFSLDIDRNALTLIKGESGSGKTTLIDLILGLRKPDYGKIDIENGSLKDCILGYMMQDTSLLNGTIAQNISLCYSDIDMDRVNELMSALGINEFAESNSEMDIGGYGQELSGGQKQRIGLARALYQKPNLLVLDEPFSAIDRATCIELVEIVSNLRKNCTIIVISHDDYFDEVADKVVQIRDASNV